MSRAASTGCFPSAVEECRLSLSVLWQMGYVFFMRLHVLFFALFLSLSTAHLVALAFVSKRWATATKPLLMPVLAGYLVSAVARGGIPLPWFILAGVGCGFLGDVFLLGQGRHSSFIAGLTAFLIGHVFYLIALLPAILSRRIEPLLLLVLIPLGLFGLWYLRFLKEGMAQLLPAVSAYMAVIIAMTTTALLRAGALGYGAWIVFTGAVSFMASDSMLGIAVFRNRSRGLDVAVMASYLLGQFLIVRGMLV